MLRFYTESDTVKGSKSEYSLLSAGWLEINCILYARTGWLFYCIFIKLHCCHDLLENCCMLALFFFLRTFINLPLFPHSLSIFSSPLFKCFSPHQDLPEIVPSSEPPLRVVPRVDIFYVGLIFMSHCKSGLSFQELMFSMMYFLLFHILECVV